MSESLDPGGFPGGGATGDGNRERLADELRRRAEKAEPEVTRDLREIARRSSGELFGLENRFKSREGIAQKIGRQREKYPALRSDEQTIVRVKDALRYTFKSNTENHTEGVETVLVELEARGYEWDETRQPENNWRLGNDYKGINMNLTKAGSPSSCSFTRLSPCWPSKTIIPCMKSSASPRLRRSARES